MLSPVPCRLLGVVTSTLAPCPQHSGISEKPISPIEQRWASVAPGEGGSWSVTSNFAAVSPTNSGEAQTKGGLRKHGALQRPTADSERVV